MSGQIANHKMEVKNETNNSVNNEGIIDYYENATMDYQYWDKEYNMHFGYCTRNPLNRAAMLRAMNKKVFEYLGITAATKGNVLDLGCGMGTVSLDGAIQYPNLQFKGINICKWQIKRGNQRLQERGVLNAILLQDDYHFLNTIEDESIDRVFALESVCHSNQKKVVLEQINRVLKKGGSLVIVDGFLKKKEGELNTIFKKLYKNLCDGWAVPGLANIEAFKNDMEEQSFEDIGVRDISWKIAPSAIHAPFVCLWFVIDTIFKGKKLHRQSFKNLKASFISLFLGMFRKSFGYYIIHAKKK